MKIEYVSKKFTPAHLSIIAQANLILREYALQGYDLTLRQLYYQFVTRDLIANKQSEYKRLGSIINDARLGGLIDWNSITDLTRSLKTPPHWTSPANIIKAAASSYAVDKWNTQEWRVEVWIEKDALSNIFAGICEELDLAYFSCRGYTSQSEMHAAALRHLRFEEEGQSVIVLHFGDHDPSGIDMTRDITDRLALFGAATEVKRVALSMEQIAQYAPPPNPAKDTDSRHADYLEKYGDSSWELDALEPAVLVQLVRDEVDDVIDNALYQEEAARETEEKQLLALVSEKWEEVSAFVKETETEQEAE